MYRLAALWAALAVPLWLLAQRLAARMGATSGPDAADSVFATVVGTFASPHAHARSMVSGFVAAVIVAFLIAQLRRWPGERSALGWGLVAAWLVARVLAFWWPEGAVVADLVFLAVAAAVLVGRARRAPVPNNLLFAGAPLVLMLSVLQPLSVLWMVPLLIAWIAGRVIPGAVNARVSSRPAQVRSDLERVAMVTLLAAVLLRLAWPQSTAADLAAVLAALTHFWRWLRWAPLAAIGAKARLAPLVLAYAWLPIALLLQAGSGWAPYGAATHALGVGLVGGMTWAMMNRTLAPAAVTPGIVERFGFACIVAAPWLRVSAQWLEGGERFVLLDLAAACWCLAFLSLAVRGLATAPVRSARPEARSADH